MTETLSSRGTGRLPEDAVGGLSALFPARAAQDTGCIVPERPMSIPSTPWFFSIFPPSASLTMGVLGSPSSWRGGHRKGSEELLAALVLGNVQFLASWTAGGGPGSSQGSVREQRTVDGAVQLRAIPPLGLSHPPLGLTIRTGQMAPVAGSSGEQRGEGRHTRVPPTHQQLLYTRHLPLQRMGSTGDFGKGWGPGWGSPWLGI